MKTKYISLVLFLCFTILTQNAVSAQTSYFLKPGGALTSLSSWGDDPSGDGSGAAPTTFANSDNWFITNNTSVTLSSSWGLGGGSSVIIGDGSSATTLIITTGGTITNNTSINTIIQDLATLDIEATYVFNVGGTDPLTGSTVIFGTNAPDIVALNSTYYNLIVAENALLNSVNITIDGTLTVNTSKVLSLNSLNLNVAAINCIGEINGGASGNSGLNINGAGGNLRFQSGGRRLIRMTVNLTSTTDVLTLNSDLTIDGSGANTCALTRGQLNINGNLFSINSPVNFNATNFTMSGSTTSSLSIGGLLTNAITNSLRMTTTSNTLAALTMNRSSRTLTLGNALNVVDLVTVSAGTLASAGNLTLKATSTKAAAVGSLCASCSVSGSVTVESYLNAGTSQGGWALIGSNGVSGRTLSNLDGQVAMTCNGCINSQSSAGGWFNSVQGWSETNCDYDTLITSSTALTPGRGFWMYLRTAPLTSTDMNWSFTGTLVQKNQTQNITTSGVCTGTNATSDGFNLLANPYPCPVSWTSIYNNNAGDINDRVYYYVQGNGGGAGPQVYQQGLGGTTTASNVIPAGQAFFVESINSSGVVTFAEDDKLPANNTTMLWRGSNNGKTSVNEHNAFRLRLFGQYDRDDALFSISPTASFQYRKREDAIKMFATPGFGGGQASYNQYTSISSLDEVSGKYMAINTFPSESKRHTIPVLVRVSTSGTYTMDATDFDNYQSCIVVRDKVTGIYTDLKVSPYVFTINDTTQTPRFELIVCENGGGVVSVQELYASEHISIGKDAVGPLVKTDFDKTTDAVISVYNILGQQLTPDIKVSGTQTTTRLDNLNVRNQVVIIKVTADNHSVSKKLIIE